MKLTWANVRKATEIIDKIDNGYALPMADHNWLKREVSKDVQESIRRMISKASSLEEAQFNIMQTSLN